ncbi:unnamed protein product [Adineta ricciae]|uniref:Apple domain-containing protein n=1 Tax=Adineta ricciae TaxID=249248 RepID=A0A815D9A0_ADIRI|nr:unnamed protein product [Adineta ricciae]
MMDSMDGTQFQCATTTCLPYVTIAVSDILQCQTTCLQQAQCKVASYRQSTSSCQLFTNDVNQGNTLEAAIGIVTMAVISGTRTPSVQVMTYVDLNFIAVVHIYKITTVLKHKKHHNENSKSYYINTIQ